MHYRESSENNWSADSIRLILTPSPNAKGMYYYAQEAGYFKTGQGYYTQRENLNSFLIVYTLSGRGFLRYREKEYTVLPGQVFFVHCMDFQHYEAEGNWEFLWVHFNGGASLSYFSRYIAASPPVAVLPGEEGNAFEGLLWRLLAANKNRDYTTEAVTSHILTGLLTALAVLPKSPGSPALMPAAVRGAVAYIERNYAQEITLQTLAAYLLVSPYTLHKEFKRHMGMPPNAYLIHCRLNHAKELLKYGDLSVKEIACQVGIENVSHFINLFKKSEHKTPRAFKIEWSQ